MVIEITDSGSIDIEQLKNAVANHEPVTFSSRTFSHITKDLFQRGLSVFLKESDQEYLYNCLSYCVLELLDNASKANAKRIYFQEKNLNINDAKDYAEGMQSFRNDITEESKYYLDKTETAEFHIDLRLNADGVLKISVSNNTGLTDFEYERIQKKVEQCKKYETMADALMDIDQTEGSGLGIISIILMLRKFGLTEEQLTFERKENETEVTITIPIDSLEEI